MLQSCARLLRGGTAIWRYATTPLHTHCSTPSSVSMSSSCPNQENRDYGLPNATWSQNMLELYNKYMELSQKTTWRRIPSYNTTVHLVGMPLDSRRDRRFFTRNLDQDGVGFEYTMFYNKAEKRMICLFQPGLYLEGLPGYLHGGCIATIIDSTTGAGAVYNYGSVLTANMNINYRNPILLGSTVIVDSHVEKLEGKKVYTRCQIRSHDDTVLHTEATCLFIKLNPDEVVCRD